MRPATAWSALAGGQSDVELGREARSHDQEPRRMDDGGSRRRRELRQRNVEPLDDDQVRTVIAASNALDRNLGLYVEVAAEPGQAVADLPPGWSATCRTAARRG